MEGPEWETRLKRYARDLHCSPHFAFFPHRHDYLEQFGNYVCKFSSTTMWDRLDELKGKTLLCACSSSSHCPAAFLSTLATLKGEGTIQP